MPGAPEPSGTFPTPLQAKLNSELVDKLIDKIRDQAQVLDISLYLQDGGDRHYDDLDQAYSDFLNNGHGGLRVRYRYKGRILLDTLLRIPGGIRLQRLKEL